jgi:hypothetical protein
MGDGRAKGEGGGGDVGGVVAGEEIDVAVERVSLRCLLALSTSNESRRLRVIVLVLQSCPAAVSSDDDRDRVGMPKLLSDGLPLYSGVGRTIRRGEGVRGVVIEEVILMERLLMQLFDERFREGRIDSWRDQGPVWRLLELKSAARKMLMEL